MRRASARFSVFCFQTPRAQQKNATHAATTTTTTPLSKKNQGTLSGVIGVAVTGRILDAYGGAASLLGWYNAHAVAAVGCVLASLVFNAFARGERVFD